MRRALLPSFGLLHRVGKAANFLAPQSSHFSISIASPNSSDDLLRSNPDGSGVDNLCTFLLHDAPGGDGGWNLGPRCTLEGDEGKKNIPEYGLLGRLRTSQKPSVYLNTYDPFCFVTLGVQGSGKSHSLSVVLENCVLCVSDQTKSTIHHRRHGEVAQTIPARLSASSTPLTVSAPSSETSVTRHPLIPRPCLETR